MGFSQRFMRQALPTEEAQRFRAFLRRGMEQYNLNYADVVNVVWTLVTPKPRTATWVRHQLEPGRPLRRENARDLTWMIVFCDRACNTKQDLLENGVARWNTPWDREFNLAANGEWAWLKTGPGVTASPACFVVPEAVEGFVDELLDTLESVTLMVTAQRRKYHDALSKYLESNGRSMARSWFESVAVYVDAWQSRGHGFWIVERNPDGSFGARTKVENPRPSHYLNAAISIAYRNKAEEQVLQDIVLKLAAEQFDVISRQSTVALSPTLADPLNGEPETREAILDARWAGTNKVKMKLNLKTESLCHLRQSRGPGNARKKRH